MQKIEFDTIKSVMERYNISRATLYRLIGRGEIEAVKVGAATRIKMSSVEEYFANLPRATTLIV